MPSPDDREHDRGPDEVMRRIGRRRRDLASADRWRASQSL
jgi:hypothetical protein